MLVLSRKKCQRLKLGDEIVLTIIDVNGEKVKLGIEAPREVSILREELETEVNTVPITPARRAA